MTARQVFRVSRTQEYLAAADNEEEAINLAREEAFLDGEDDWRAVILGEDDGGEDILRASGEKRT